MRVMQRSHAMSSRAIQNPAMQDDQSITQSIHASIDKPGQDSLPARTTQLSAAPYVPYLNLLIHARSVQVGCFGECDHRMFEGVRVDGTRQTDQQTDRQTTANTTK
mmetsp:Transcript_6120/g.14721  ORF Transcript_6120/g.14721 Transcript_6120/m.14721 type:complete len:106 (-) Transcript_6120:1411-1728(-)